MALQWPAPAGDEAPPGTTHRVGVDEAGRGPVMGPLVVAAVAAAEDGGEDALRELGVRDSKRLEAARRERLAAEVSSLPHVAIEVPAEDVDALRATATLNVIESRIFASAVLGVTAQLPEEASVTAFLDAADASETTFERLFRSSLSGGEGAERVVHVVCRHGADDCFPVVSAASIIAKSRRERAVAAISEELGEDIGSGYPSDARTIAFLEDWIREKGELPPHTRRSWSTARRLLDRHGDDVRRLDEF